MLPSFLHLCVLLGGILITTSHPPEFRALDYLLLDSQSAVYSNYGSCAAMTLCAPGSGLSSYCSRAVLSFTLRSSGHLTYCPSTCLTLCFSRTLLQSPVHLSYCSNVVLTLEWGFCVSCSRVPRSQSKLNRTCRRAGALLCVLQWCPSLASEQGISTTVRSYASRELVQHISQSTSVWAESRHLSAEL